MTLVRRLGLRQRLMVVGVLGVAGALLLGGTSLYAVMTASLSRAVSEQARSSAAGVAALVDSSRLPETVPASGAQVVQVLDAQNRVIAGSAAADRLTALLDPGEREEATRHTVTVPGSRAGLDGRLAVAAVEAGPSAQRLLVVAAVPTAADARSQATLRRLLLVTFPLVLAVMALIAWRVIGSALRPVEALREGAERIGAGPHALRAPGASPRGRGEPADVETGRADIRRLPVPAARDEIAALATTLNGMLDRLDRAREAQAAFVADAAHELRSPLATLRTQLEVAGRVGEGGALPGELLPAVHRLGTLVEDLLVLARTGGEAPPPVREPVDLVDLATEVAGRYPRVRVEAPTAHPSVVVDAARAELDRAVTCLVDNAVRHAASSVVVTVVPGPVGPRLVVVDDGAGIPAADRERVFDRFIRLDEARDRDTGGSGLGLSIARQLLRRNGAEVSLEDAGPGLRAVVSFRPQAG